ncbi:LytR family transcriptional regulator [Streptomyces sp. RKND-216]|uniref:LCP family protein n=1 Tax=Streptomyces sp. RKND-216 TaxID=2562581 RepID=UPI00109E0D22|nr:LCP family protein [Streptomyces sp. RKND-216]THA24624.1 LytR family transcriptional regulator [Streptomyces sp. RKND-216]
MTNPPPHNHDEPFEQPRPRGVSAARRGAAYRYGPRSRHARRRSGLRRLRRACVMLLVTVLAAGLGGYAWADHRLDQAVDLGAYGPRPPAGEGTTYLIVGSDSRGGLSAQERADLHAGGGGGRRADVMILLHTGSAGTTMVSLPRDSWVTVPAHTRPETGKHVPAGGDKLNAAFSHGGPELLLRTVEHNTGLRVDHYAEIGFGGFVDVVDSLGGVRMCLRRDIRDEKSGADLRKGCQDLDGADALAFVRQRHQEARGDLGRTRNQQRLLAALAHQAARPDSLLDPAESYGALSAGLDALVVDRGMSLRDLAAMARAVRDVAGGDGRRMNVPVSGVGVPTSKGSAVTWDRSEASRLFRLLRQDRAVPPGLPPG